MAVQTSHGATFVIPFRRSDIAGNLSKSALPTYFNLSVSGAGHDVDSSRVGGGVPVVDAGRDSPRTRTPEVPRSTSRETDALRPGRRL